MLILAPSDSRTEIRASRALIARAEAEPELLFGGGAPQVLAVGQSIPLPRSGRAASVSLPIDVNRTIERVLSSVPIDVVHVHEPFAPSASSAALRHSRALNVASFHEPAERALSTQMARPLVELFFGRLDARTVSYRATGDLLDRYFPGTHELIGPGVDRVEPADGGRSEGEPPELLFCLREERAALRVFLRALRRLPLELDWRATIWTGERGEPAVRLNRRLRERVQVLGPADATPEQLAARASVICLASGGPRLAPGLISLAQAAGAVPVVPHLALYAELTDDGECGLLFPVGDHLTLAGQIERLIADPALRAELARRGEQLHAGRTWARVAEELEGVYARIAARRQDPAPNPKLRRLIDSRPHIECDLHMHTDHSPDCATPPEVLVETAKQRGLDAIAVTDHNEISGALAAREVAERIGGIKVIVGEEIKTAEQGEVIGLFIEQLIPRGMTMAETIAAIREQGGLVYVPHPFDRFHTVPDYEHLLEIVEQIDILEVFNPRVAFSAFNEEAVRFAAKYRIVAGAGSDGHVAQALGSVRIRLRDFEGPQEFLEAMREADIVRKHRNLVYVQTLKFLQTASRRRARRRA